MVNIDTVYQRVLALANKEQRGYITPQQFNLFANQAQMEIFEQYFYDLNQASRNPGNNKIIADVDDILEEKIGIFEEVQLATWVSTNMPLIANYMAIPSEIYRFEKIWYTNPDTTPKKVPVEIMSYKEVQGAILSPLTSPTKFMPIGSITSNGLQVLTDQVTVANPAFGYNFEIIYIRRPDAVAWSYFVVGGKALYDSTGAANFELHSSEESELVYKILKYSGMSIKNIETMRAGQIQEQGQQQQEKQ